MSVMGPAEIERRAQEYALGMGQPAVDRMKVMALQMAIDANRGLGLDAKQTVKAAEIFEAFLRGEVTLADN